MFKEVADIQTADMLNLPVPDVEYHNVSVEPTAIQKDMVKSLAERAEAVRNKTVDPSTDNMLSITNDGRKLALDQRVINEMLPDDDNSKVSVCADNVFDIWEKTTDIKGTQLVFCDLSTPKSNDTFSVYDSIRQKLIDKGVPESDIAFIHNADSETKKKELFLKVRSGDVRILLGSTARMGAGTNVQTRLVASHDADCPWRPADLAQRAGRIVRQGNMNKNVHIYRYVTKDTFDSYLWQLVESKQKFISQIMTSKSPVRSADDIDATALSYAEIKALATGNPHIKEKMELDVEVSKLRLIKSRFLSEKYSLEDKVMKYYPKRITELTEKIVCLKDDAKVADENPRIAEKFNAMTIDGLGYYEKEKAGKALIERCKNLNVATSTPIGDYRGFSMELSFDEFSKAFVLTLKNSYSHKVELGADVFGNIQRIDNMIEGISKKVIVAENELTECNKQFENAKVESTKEFPKEDELTEKVSRLAALETLLNMDKSEREDIGDSQPMPETIKERIKEIKNTEMER